MIVCVDLMERVNAGNELAGTFREIDTRSRYLTNILGAQVDLEQDRRIGELEKATRTFLQEPKYAEALRLLEEYAPVFQGVKTLVDRVYKVAPELRTQTTTT